MAIRDLQLCLTNGGPDQYKLVVECWENVRNVYCSHLGNSLVVDKISKLCIFLGPYEGKGYLPPLDNIASLYRSDFNLDAYLETSSANQDLAALEYVESSLVSIARRFDVPTAPIVLAAQKTVEGNFRYEFELKRISRVHPNKKLKAKLFVCFRRGGGGTAVEARIFDGNDKLLGVETIVEKEWYSRRWKAPHWITQWQGTVFVAENHGPGIISFRSHDYGG